jgi:hypothetical protein
MYDGYLNLSKSDGREATTRDSDDYEHPHIEVRTYVGFADC